MNPNLAWGMLLAVGVIISLFIAPPTGTLIVSSLCLAIFAAGYYGWAAFQKKNNEKAKGKEE